MKTFWTLVTLLLVFTVEPLSANPTYNQLNALQPSLKHHVLHRMENKLHFGTEYVGIRLSVGGASKQLVIRERILELLYSPDLKTKESVKLNLEGLKLPKPYQEAIAKHPGLDGINYPAIHKRGGDQAVKVAKRMYSRYHLMIHDYRLRMAIDVAQLDWEKSVIHPHTTARCQVLELHCKGGGSDCLNATGKVVYHKKKAREPWQKEVEDFEVLKDFIFTNGLRLCGGDKNEHLVSELKELFRRVNDQPVRNPTDFSVKKSYIQAKPGSGQKLKGSIWKFRSDGSVLVFPFNGAKRSKGQLKLWESDPRSGKTHWHQTAAKQEMECSVVGKAGGKVEKYRVACTTAEGGTINLLMAECKQELNRLFKSHRSDLAKTPKAYVKALKCK